MGDLDKLQRFYEEKRLEVDQFLQRCAARGQSIDAKELFSWLCHNLLTVQVSYDKVVETLAYLEENALLFHGDVYMIERGLRVSGYRFTNKAKNLWAARKRFFDEECEIGIVYLWNGYENGFAFLKRSGLFTQSACYFGCPYLGLAGQIWSHR